MDRLISPKVTKETVSNYGFKFSKSLGQNFLIDENILNKIIDGAEVSSEDVVFEIGPGIGTLTQALADKAKRVVAVEIDKTLLPILADTLRDFNNVEVIHNDVLKLDLQKLVKEKSPNKSIKVIANLPYYVTTPIVMKFLEEKVSLENMVVMVQKEVADRMRAKPGTKDYGSLSVAVQYYCEPKIITKVPRSVFIPQPNVESTVIKLEILKAPRVKVDNEKLMFGIVRAAFGKRRKTILNALASSNLGFDKEMVRTVLNESGIKAERRGETLDIEEYAALAQIFNKYI